MLSAKQINAVLSAGSDTRTPVAPVPPFADDPQGSWLAEERAASAPCCRKAPFAQRVAKAAEKHAEGANQEKGPARDTLGQ